MTRIIPLITPEQRSAVRSALSQSVAATDGGPTRLDLDLLTDVTCQAVDEGLERMAQVVNSLDGDMRDIAIATSVVLMQFIGDNIRQAYRDMILDRHGIDIGDQLSG